MPVDTIKYDVLSSTRELDELKNLFYTDRLVVEANPLGKTITPTINYNGTSIALATFTGTTHSFHEIAVNRLGPIQDISFAPINEIEWYSIQTFIRPVQLGVQIVHSGGGPQRKTFSQFPGRTSDYTSNIIFDINPFSFLEDARHINPVLRYLWIDIETGAESVTPVLVNDQGVETTLTSITAATRGIQEFSILGTNRIKQIRLDGDFSNSDVILYDIECDMYIPNKRRMGVG